MAIRSIPKRQDVPAEDRWDLTPFFTSDQAWEQLYAETAQSLDTYEGFKGTLHRSASDLKAAVMFDLEVSRNLDQLSTYAHLKNDEDQSEQKYQGMYQRTSTLITRASELSSFMRPEILAIADDRVQAFLKDPALAEIRFHLEKMLRYRPHTADAPIESLLAMSRDMAQTPHQVFSQLNNVDFVFGTITDSDGTAVELSHGNFSTFLIHPSRDIRKIAFEQYYRIYDDHKHTLAATLAGSVRADTFYARSRKFDSSRARTLFPDDVPVTVYDNLVSTVRGNLAPLIRYLALRQRVLGLEALHIYDTYVPIGPPVDFHLPYEAAVDLCAEALAPLGDPYVAVLTQGLRAGWVDRYENRGKRSGAYSSGCYDSPPYILLNYEAGTINSLYTLIHEAGHSMHSHYSRLHQPYVYCDYTIFVAEVASTFNEMLLTAHLLEHYKDDPRMKAYILNREIDNIRATLCRQTMFAEFEHRVHQMDEADEPLTLASMTDAYHDLLNVYFGGGIIIDEALKLEYLRIPHFYSAYYVYKYATGISAAIALAENVRSGGEAEREAYIDFLKLGGSQFPLDALRSAGVDMTSPLPIEQALNRLSQLVSELEKTYK
ncbi:MAG: oligoendopeptidase F [Myxococcota bacterium]|nr:oligoendopeptidase F [Myxococcota bacterium]